MAAALDRVRSWVAERRLFASPRARRRVVVHAAVVAGFLVVAGLLVRPHLALLTDAAALRRLVGGFGVWAPLAFVLLQAAQVVVAPVPGQVLAVVAGYLFGAGWGTLYNLLGVTLGSTLAFWLSRRYGRAYVERMFHPDAVDRFDAVDDDHARLALFVFFLVPGLPDDLVCFVGGLTRLPLRQLVVIAVVGRAPAFFLVNVVGDLLGTNRTVEAALLAGGILVVSAVGYLYRDRLVGLFGGG